MLSPEAKKFLASQGFQIEKLIARRRRGLTPEQVEEAAQIVYDQIASGELVIKQIAIARRIWAVAKTIPAPPKKPPDETAQNELRETIRSHKHHISRLKKDASWERLRSKEYETMLWRMIWVAYITTSISALAVGVFSALVWRVL